MARAIRKEHGSDLADKPMQTTHRDGVRGGVEGGVRVHSVRHPIGSLVAWHEVIFTGTDGILRIRHDDAGDTDHVGVIAAAIRTVMRPESVGLVRGYDVLLGLEEPNLSPTDK